MDEAFWMRRSKKKPISLPLGILPLCPRRLGLCNKSAFGPWAVIRSVNLCTSFTLLREVMLSMALTFFGLASIPRWETMNPKNLRDKTLNTHFTEFNIIWYFLKVSKVSLRSSKCNCAFLLFTSMLSTYTFIFRPICLLNMWFTSLWYLALAFFWPNGLTL